MKAEEKTQEVNLEMMLACREKRAEIQTGFLLKYNRPIISFTMNIAGPVKTSYLIKRGFSIGLERIEGALLSSKIKVLERRIFFNHTGPEAFMSVDCEAAELKRIVTGIEERDELGRLFDIDVINTDGKKQERQRERFCLLCNNRAKECASRRLHSVSELQEKTKEILLKSVTEIDSDTVASRAVKALLYEVAVTPKPGLVDRNNCGSHKDMDFYTFIDSSVALFSYFKRAYSIGFENEDEKKCFEKLRKAGMEAEQTMFFATGGINTHKGAIFSLGLFCCASGFCAVSGNDVFSCISKMTEGLGKADFEKLPENGCKTAGEKLFLKYGLLGIRGEAEKGFPTVKDTGLPVLEKLLSEGCGYDRAGYLTLLNMMARTVDTNTVSRGGKEYAEQIRKKISCMLKDGEPELCELEHLDKTFISDNLSPGGIADLLSVCFFLCFMRGSDNG